MDFSAMSDKAVLHELGSRIRQLRLNRNITQEDLADRVLLSVGTVKSLEQGQGKLTTLVAVLRELDAMQGLEQLLPEPRLSPQQLLKMQGERRRRATSSKGKPQPEESEW